MPCYLQMAAITLSSQENCFLQMQGPFFFYFMGEKSSYFLYSLLQESKTLKSSYYNMIPTKIKMGH